MIIFNRSKLIFLIIILKSVINYYQKEGKAFKDIFQMMALVFLFLICVVVFVIFGCFFKPIIGYHVFSAAPNVGYLLDVLFFGIIGLMVGYLVSSALDKHYDNKDKKEAEKLFSQIP